MLVLSKIFRLLHVASARTHRNTSAKTSAMLYQARPHQNMPPNFGLFLGPVFGHILIGA